MSAPHSVFQPRLLAGQTALITGASSGINLGIAKRFAEHGANVIVVACNPEKIARACHGHRACAPINKTRTPCWRCWRC